MKLMLVALVLLGLADEPSALAGQSFAEQTRNDEGAIGRAIIDQARIDSRRSALTTPSQWRPAGEEEDIQRAAAWGRCVVRSTPDKGSGYLLANRHTWQDPRAYRAVFKRCREQVGRFGQDHRPVVLRAAIADAQRNYAMLTASSPRLSKAV